MLSSQSMAMMPLCLMLAMLCPVPVTSAYQAVINELLRAGDGIPWHCRSKKKVYDYWEKSKEESCATNDAYRYHVQPWARSEAEACLNQSNGVREPGCYLYPQTNNYEPPSQVPWHTSSDLKKEVRDQYDTIQATPCYGTGPSDGVTVQQFQQQKSSCYPSLTDGGQEKFDGWIWWKRWRQKWLWFGWLTDKGGEHNTEPDVNPEVASTPPEAARPAPNMPGAAPSATQTNPHEATRPAPNTPGAAPSATQTNPPEATRPAPNTPGAAPSATQTNTLEADPSAPQTNTPGAAPSAPQTNTPGAARPASDTSGINWIAACVIGGVLWYGYQNWFSGSAHDPEKKPSVPAHDGAPPHKPGPANLLSSDDPRDRHADTQSINGDDWPWRLIIIILASIVILVVLAAVLLYYFVCAKTKDSGESGDYPDLENPYPRRLQRMPRPHRRNRPRRTEAPKRGRGRSGIPEDHPLSRFKRGRSKSARC